MLTNTPPEDGAIENLDRDPRLPDPAEIVAPSHGQVAGTHS
jgi:hypothetical protein